MAESTSPVLDNFMKAIRRERPASVPVAFCISSQYICAQSGVDVKRYLYDPDIKLKTQCAFQDAYPDMMLVPGIYPDFGCGVVEPSAFGCELLQRQNNPLSPQAICPQAMKAQPGNRGFDEIRRLKPPDPKKDGLMPQVLEHYRYFWEHLDQRYIDLYGYLTGFAFCMGPVETAALVMGYENFLIGLHDFPLQIHQFLRMVTDFTVSWLRIQEEVNGRLKRIYLFDHTPARVGPAHFEEFVFPYLQQVCAEFPSAIKIFHICERNISHVLPRFSDLGIDVLYFAANLSEVKEAIGKRVCLMGNINAIDLVRQGTPEQILEESRRCMAIGADTEGGYILAPSGAFIPGTPPENIQALIDATGARTVGYS
jgi:uroporphyrinogen decarboxylase